MNTIWENLEKLINNRGLSFLEEKYKINAVRDGDLICLKYSVESPKTHWVTRACRGTVVYEFFPESYKIIAVGFERFYNLGEALELQEKFDWDNAVAEEKWDGSLIKLFYFPPQKCWIASTSGTPTGKGSVDKGYTGTFSDLFWETFDKCGESRLDLNTDRMYIYELITPFNRVVVDYGQEWSIRLLAAREAISLEEIPLYHQFEKLDRKVLLEAASQMSGLEREGFILLDKNGNRIKVKSPSYVALHREVCDVSPDFFELWSTGELEEFLLYFEHHREVANQMLTAIEACRQSVRSLVDSFDGDFKAFALANKGNPDTKIAFVLLRNPDKSFDEVLRGFTKKGFYKKFLPS